MTIQRGREEGVPLYNDAREAVGLPRLSSFSQITSNSALASQLEQTYSGDIDRVDMYIGGLAEDHSDSGSAVGPLFRAIILNQYQRTRDSDRFYFQNADAGFNESEIESLIGTTLASIIARNTPCACALSLSLSLCLSLCVLVASAVCLGL